MTEQREPSAISYLIAGRGYLNAMSLLENALKQGPAKLGFSGSVLETLLGHGVELIFKAHLLYEAKTTDELRNFGHNLSKILEGEFASQLVDPAAEVINRSNYDYNKQQHELRHKLTELVLEETLETDPFEVNENDVVNSNQAEEQLRFHIELLTMRMGGKPFPARYPVTGYYKQPNFEFICKTIESFANWLEPRCYDKYKRDNPLPNR